MFESMLRQEIAFHDMDMNRSSILTTQLAINPPLCKGLTSDKIGILCQGFSGVGFAIIIAFIYNWKLSLVMVVFVPVSFLSGVFTSRVATNVKINGVDSVDEGGRILIESIENMKTVVSLGKLLVHGWRMIVRKISTFVRKKEKKTWRNPYFWKNIKNSKIEVS